MPKNKQHSTHILASTASSTVYANDNYTLHLPLDSSQARQNFAEKILNTNEHLKCQMDSDCQIYHGLCGNSAVNNRYAKAFGEYMRVVEMSIDCAVSGRKPLKPYASCVKNQCQLDFK